MIRGIGETIREMATEGLHMFSLVNTADRSLNVIDCVYKVTPECMSSCDCNAIYCVPPVKCSKTTSCVDVPSLGMQGSMARKVEWRPMARGRAQDGGRFVLSRH